MKSKFCGAENSYWLLFSFCFLYLLSHARAQCTTQIDECSCQTTEGKKIDLRPLEQTDGQPRFKDVSDSKNADKFSYNPCSGFTEEQCEGVSACQIQGLEPPAYFNIGDPGSASFITDPTRGLELQYSTAEGRNAYVQLKCDPNADPPELTAEGEQPENSGNYYMALRSKWCCEQGGEVVPTHHTQVTISISAGSVLLIIFFVSAFTYFLLGVIVQRFVRRQRGKEMLPNAGFWTQFPGLVKDGFFFVIRRGRRSGYQST